MKKKKLAPFACAVRNHQPPTTSCSKWLTLLKAKIILPVYCIAKNSPVINWILKQAPKSEPKFQKEDKFLAIGRSTSEEFTIFNKGCLRRVDVIGYSLKRIYSPQSFQINRIFSFWTLSVLGFSIVWGLRRTRIFTLWIALELNLLAFITFLLHKWEFSRLVALQYFLIQRLGSALLLLRALNLSGQRNLLWRPRIRRWGLLLVTSICLKLGVVPFQGWIIRLGEHVEWDTFFLLLSLQKVLPLRVIVNLISRKFILPIIYLNLIIAVIFAVGEIHLKRFFIFSSFMARGWLLRGLKSFEVVFTYLFFYSFGLWGVRFLRGWHNYQEVKFYEFNQLSLYLAVLNLGLILQFAGFPPFVRFYGKLILLSWTLNQNLLLLRVSLIGAARVFLYFYLRLRFPSLVGRQLNFVRATYQTPSFVGGWVLIIRSLRVCLIFIVSHWRRHLTPLK